MSRDISACENYLLKVNHHFNNTLKHLVDLALLVLHVFRFLHNQISYCLVFWNIWFIGNVQFGFYFDSSSHECFISIFFFNVSFPCTTLLFYSAFIIFQSHITHQLLKKNICVLISALSDVALWHRSSRKRSVFLYW